MITISGLDKVVSNLNKEIARIKKATGAGLYEAGLFIKAKALPITPIDYGNLRGSCFVIGIYNTSYPSVSFKGPQAGPLYSSFSSAVGEALSIVEQKKALDKISVVVGYGAFYAAFVHENPNAGKFAGEWKFLETTVKQYSPEILSIIKERAKI